VAGHEGRVRRACFPPPPSPQMLPLVLAPAMRRKGGAQRRGARRVPMPQPPAKPHLAPREASGTGASRQPSAPTKVAVGRAARQPPQSRVASMQPQPFSARAAIARSAPERFAASPSHAAPAEGVAAQASQRRTRRRAAIRTAGRAPAPRPQIVQNIAAAPWRRRKATSTAPAFAPPFAPPAAPRRRPRGLLAHRPSADAYAAGFAHSHRGAKSAQRQAASSSIPARQQCRKRRCRSSTAGVDSTGG